MRKCGDCQACCKIMPIGEIGKKANTRCSFQKFKVGCTVHGTSKQPPSCRMWSCWWLLDPAFDLPRPDRAGYVVDPTPDFVVFGDDVFKGKRVAAIQVWADASRPNDWVAVQPWLCRVIADREMVAVIRFGSDHAVTMIPPQLSETQDWQLIDSRMIQARTASNIRASLAREAQAAMADALSNNPQAVEQLTPAPEEIRNPDAAD